MSWVPVVLFGGVFIGLAVLYHWPVKDDPNERGYVK